MGLGWESAKLAELLNAPENHLEGAFVRLPYNQAVAVANQIEAMILAAIEEREQFRSA